MTCSDTGTIASVSNGSSHSSSFSRGGTGKLMSITVRKDTPESKAGIQLEQDKHGQVTVKNIAKNGLFGATELEIGDIILSVNRRRLSEGEGPEVLMKVVHQFNTISIALRKPPPSGVPLKRRKKKATAGSKDNGQSKTDTYYDGSAKHNADGSLRVERDSGESSSKHKRKKKTKTVTISAKKKAEASPRSVTKSPHSSSSGVGLELGIENDKLIVKRISQQSIFRSTNLSLGDRILSINDMSFRRYVDIEYAMKIIKNAKLMVTLVVEKKKSSSPLSMQKNSKKTRSTHKRKEKKSASIANDSANGSSQDDDDVSSDSSHNNNDDDEFAIDGGEYEFATETKFLIERYKPVTISAPKSAYSQNAGLDFKVVKTTRGSSCGRKTTWVYVDKIAGDSIFHKTSLKVGDKIMSINDVDLRQAPDMTLAYKTCCRATETVALVVLKDEKIFKETEFSFDNSITNLEWKV